MTGRSSTFDQATADAICLRIIEGTCLSDLCKEDGFPDKSTVWRWAARNIPFRQQLTLAMEMHADGLADAVTTIASRQDDPNIDKAVRFAQIQRDRLTCDMYRRKAARLYPRKYSERWAVHTSDQPIESSAAFLPMNSEEVRAHFKEVLDRAEQEMGLPPQPTVSDEARLVAIMASNKPVSPEIYELLHNAKANGKANGSSGH
jgi:hypothetical protein